MSKYGQFCPVSKSAEILGDPWSILIVRELMLGSSRFSELQRGLPKISPTVLNTRLKDLANSGVVTRRKLNGQRGHAYYLTTAGKELSPVIESLVVWGMRWARENMEEEDFDASFLMFDIQRNLKPALLPDGPTVLCFQFPELQEYKQWWLLIEPNEQVDICYEDPGKDTDLYITVSLKDLVAVYMGDQDLVTSLNSGVLKIIGDPLLKHEFAKWFPISRAAQVPRVAKSSVTGTH